MDESPEAVFPGRSDEYCTPDNDFGNLNPFREPKLILGSLRVGLMVSSGATVPLMGEEYVPL
jgi:hypothetical protein